MRRLPPQREDGWRACGTCWTDPCCRLGHVDPEGTRVMRITPPHARFATAIAALALSACATVVGIAPQSLSVTSSPSGAHVLIDGADSGATPLRLALRQRQRTPMRLQLVHEGHDTASIMLASHVRRGFLAWDLSYILIAPLSAAISDHPGGAPSIAAVAFVAFVPVVTDVLTGSLWALDRDSVHVELRAKPAPP